MDDRLTKHAYETARRQQEPKSVWWKEGLSVLVLVITVLGLVVVAGFLVGLGWDAFLAGWQITQ